MPVINVQLVSGRTPDQKSAFIKEVAQVAMRILEVPESAVTIILSEVQPEHWGVGSRTMTEVRAARAG